MTYDINLWLYYSDNGFTLKNYLFGGVTLTPTNPDPDKYFLFLDMVFDVRGNVSLPNGGFG